MPLFPPPQSYPHQMQQALQPLGQPATGDQAPTMPGLLPDESVLMQQQYEAEAFGDNAPQQEPREAVNIEGLAIRLKAEFGEAESAREMVNLRWLDDLQQYRGIYSEKICSQLCKNKGSSAFYRLTTVKVNTMTARLMDLLFPQRTKNWAINSTPDPMLPDDVIIAELGDEIQKAAETMVQGQLAEWQSQGLMPDQQAMADLAQQAQFEAFQVVNTQEARLRIAQKRAQAMEQVIDDQLKEGSANGQLRPSWRQNCRVVVKSACLYGMGCLKGPLIEEVETKRFVPSKDEFGQTQWNEETFKTEFRPYHEAVSIWEVYPDPGARIPAELRFVWQKHTKTDKDLRELFNVPGFRVDKIMDYMREHPEGDAELSTWETQVRDLNPDNGSNSGMSRLKNRYTLLERWGYLTGEDLREAGVDISEDQLQEVYPSCVWMLGDRIIKASINPLEGIDIPFHFYPYQEDDSSFWPEGIACQLRTPQAAINAAVRAMQDNAALSSGPITAINVANLPAHESIDDMRAGKTFLFDKPNVRIGDVFQAVTVPSSIEHNLNLAQFWSNVADEVSTPRFNQGDGNIQGAGQTASGLSMLMGASNILLKDHVKDFDDNVVSPFIRAMFKWNMKWNEREDIKGDFEVVASGSQSLIAKEVRAQQIPALVQYLGIPSFAPYIKPKELLEVALEQTDLPAERILRTEEEANRFQQEQLEQQALAQAHAEVQALTEQLESMGMPPDEIQRRLMSILAQTVAEGPKVGAMQQPQQQAPSSNAVNPMKMGEIPSAPPQPTHPGAKQLPVKAPSFQ